MYQQSLLPLSGPQTVSRINVQNTYRYSSKTTAHNFERSLLVYQAAKAKRQLSLKIMFNSRLSCQSAGISTTQVVVKERIFHFGQVYQMAVLQKRK